MTIIRSRAPLRVSFGGGGTDVPPYPEERGGAVLNATINRYVYATLVSRVDRRVLIRSLDYGTAINYQVGEVPAYDGQLDLAIAAIKCFDLPSGVELLLHSDAPPGCGLGTSSTVVVAILGALRHWLRLPMSHYEIAALAHKIEREDVGIRGGSQDQYAATFGGINYIEFSKDYTVVNPLRVDEATVYEMEYRLVLCYTGSTRLSAGIINDQVEGYVSGKAEVVKSLDETKALAFTMKNAMLLGQVSELGRLLGAGWERKRKFSNKITDVHIDSLYDVGINNGALGGKLLGAGGGGYLLFLAEEQRKQELVRALQSRGVQVADLCFDMRGLQSWIVQG